MDTMTAAPTLTPGNKPNSAGNNRLVIMIGLVIAVLLLIAIALLLFIAVTTGMKNNSTNQTINTVTDSTVTPKPQPQTRSRPELIISSPESEAKVNGKVAVSGKITAFLGDAKVEIKDALGNVIGQRKFLIDQSNIDLQVEFSGDIDIIESPKSLKGTVVFSPVNDPSIDLTKTVDINFEVQDASARVKVFAPLENQVLSSNEVLFKGQIKDFFEGTMNFRIKDEEGTEIFSGFVIAGDNYGQFADFTKTITINNLSSAVGTTGTWEIYDISAKDGSETVLYSFNIRFQ